MVSMDISTQDTKRTIITPSRVVAIIAIIIMTVVSQNIFVNLAHAETGKGTDIFKVILTIFGVENTKGDVIALVSVNNGESSRVKFLETEAFKPVPSNMSSLVMAPNPNSNAAIMEYVATFPNVTVNSGAEYKACVMTTKDLELLCKSGQNSPASRPEFIDLNLDEAKATGTERFETEEQ
jgi:hypothetical protein